VANISKDQLKQLTTEAAQEFDGLCGDRMKLGEEKYGPAKWLTVDTLEEALFELADLANYAKMTFMRVRLLQAQLESLDETALDDFSKEIAE
jgi:hypothetical protein